MVKWSNGQMVKWSNGQMVKWSNGQVKAQSYALLHKEVKVHTDSYR